MLDVLCIGNATLDVFIHIDKKFKSGKKVIFPQGSKIETENINYETGGGANNTAVGLSRLKCKTGIFSIVGKDKSGPVVLEELKKDKVKTGLIVRDKKLKTSYSAIITGFEGDRIILTHSRAIKKINKIVLPLNKMKAKWFHISSFHVAPKALTKIINFAYKNKIKIAWNPGNIELKHGLKKLKPLLKKTNVLFLNKKESELLTKEKNVKKALKLLGKFCKIVVITQGKKGVSVFADKYYFAKTKKIKKKDSTGAGDAFNSAFNAALIKNKKVKEALKWGMKNAQSVIKFIGAKNRLLTLKEIKSN